MYKRNDIIQIGEKRYRPILNWKQFDDADNTHFLMRKQGTDWQDRGWTHRPLCQKDFSITKRKKRLFYYWEEDMSREWLVAERIPEPEPDYHEEWRGYYGDDTSAYFTIELGWAIRCTERGNAEYDLSCLMRETFMLDQLRNADMDVIAESLISAGLEDVPEMSNETMLQYAVWIACGHIRDEYYTKYERK